MPTAIAARRSYLEQGLKFKARAKEIVLRNCTHLPKALQQDIVLLAMKAILEAPTLSGDTSACPDDSGGTPPPKRAKATDTTQTDGAQGRERQVGDAATDCDGTAWRRGGAVSLGTLATLVGKERLRLLKSNCGGLKTLLRNHWQTFLGQYSRRSATIGPGDILPLFVHNVAARFPRSHSSAGAGQTAELG